MYRSIVVNPWGSGSTGPNVAKCHTCPDGTTVAEGRAPSRHQLVAEYLKLRAKRRRLTKAEDRAAAHDSLAEIWRALSPADRDELSCRIAQQDLWVGPVPEVLS